jgi:hypothetical protein
VNGAVPASTCTTAWVVRQTCRASRFRCRSVISE